MLVRASDVSLYNTEPYEMESVAENPKSQAEKFADLARELECDEDEAAFDEKLKRVAEPKPLSEKPS